MFKSGQKCVLVIDGALPAGVAANTAAILGITLGKRFPEIVGPDVADAAGRVHTGITGSPIPILKGDRALLHDLRERLWHGGIFRPVDRRFLRCGAAVPRLRRIHQRGRRGLPGGVHLLRPWRSAETPKRSAASPAACRCCGNE